MKRYGKAQSRRSKQTDRYVPRNTDDLGGADAVGKLIDALTDAAAPDPTADDPTCLALPLAQALLLVVAHHDAQRATSASNLRAVFSAFDANGDGKATRLVLHQNGASSPAKRID